MDFSENEEQRLIRESVSKLCSELPHAAADIFDIEVDYNTDLWFARPTREIIEAMARSSADSYMYVFTRNLRDPSLRAPHAMELDELDRYFGDRFNSAK